MQKKIAGNKVRKAREQNQQTQAQAAAVVGVEPVTWRFWENEYGDRRMPAGLFELYLLKTKPKNEEKP